MAKLGLVITQVRGVSYSPKDLHDSLNDESIILLRACLETHLSIMKRFNSMLAMAI